jgi:putative transposase
MPVHEICRRMGSLEPSFYRWRRKSARTDAAEIRRLKLLEEKTGN